MKRQNKVLLTMMLYSLSNIILSVIGGIYGLGAIASGTAELNSGLFGTANEISSAIFKM